MTQDAWNQVFAWIGVALLPVILGAIFIPAIMNFFRDDSSRPRSEGSDSASRPGSMG